MDFNLMEWINLAARWVHIYVAILWVGQTYFFMWIEGRLTEGEAGDAGKVWMVHSGGFYVVEKQKIPELLPRTLHWFKWEAAFTWLSGMVLLVVVYYMGGALIDTSVADISAGQGAAIGLGMLAVSWAVYDLLWLSPLAKTEWLAATISFVLIMAVSFGLTKVFSGRAAYMHVGAMFGTLMAANVWIRILPAQRQMVAALQEGKPADLTLATRAKFRSKHNSFMVVPLIFIMVSNHFPVATYGSNYGWLVLSVLVLVGWGAARLIRSL